jgi:hypothetical protein
MAYKVIKHFTDMQDNNHPYNVGDEYPRKGVKVLASRYKELASSKNRQGAPLIEEIREEAEEPKQEKKSKSVEKADEE